ncbi:hypothetical protein ACOI1C_02390, partial [Bacillus sp. DJP31]|uniref:hypothetical protein n=1 Tax=Bacillus sp. DJP31 TaxID=3409789 RepID=UPI003BB5991D
MSKSTCFSRWSFNKVSNLNNKWVESTIALIKLGEVEDGKYVNYNTMINKETSLDETWKAVYTLQYLNTRYNKIDIINYVKQYKAENEIDKLKINSILKMTEQPLIYESNYDQKIQTLLKQSNLSNEERLDELFTYHLYLGENLKISETTVNDLKGFLKSFNLSVDSHYGYFYDLAYLCNEYGIANSSLIKEYWQEKLLKESMKKEIALVDVYYIVNINILLGNSLNSDLINHIVGLETKEGSYNVIAHQKEGTMFATFLVIDILGKSGNLDLVKKEKIVDYILRQQDANTGGFVIRRIAKPDLTSGILAEYSLKILGNKNRSLPSSEIINLLSNHDNDWKLKYFGLRLIREELSDKQKLLINNDVQMFWKE